MRTLTRCYPPSRCGSIQRSIVYYFNNATHRALSRGTTRPLREIAVNTCERLHHGEVWTHKSLTRHWYTGLKVSGWSREEHTEKDVLPRKRMIAWHRSRNLGPVSTASSMQVASTVPNSADLRATPSAHHGGRVVTTHDPLDECMVAFVSEYWF